MILRLKIWSVKLLPCSEARLFFSNDLLRLRLQSVQYDLHHDFAWVADEADRSVVLALLQVAFFGKCDDQDWIQRVGPCLRDHVADCCESGKTWLKKFEKRPILKFLPNHETCQLSPMNTRESKKYW